MACKKVSWCVFETTKKACIYRVTGILKYSTIEMGYIIIILYPINLSIILKKGFPKSTMTNLYGIPVDFLLFIRE